MLSSITVAEGELTPVEAATVFGHYLHRLVSFLPDEAIPYCLFKDQGSFTLGETAQLLSQDRFLHVNLWLDPPDSTCAVLLPPDELCSPEIIRKLDEVLKVHPRVIPERRLNELWGGVDELIVFEEAISTQGKRQLLGFEASGGIIKRLF